MVSVEQVVGAQWTSKSMKRVAGHRASLCQAQMRQSRPHFPISCMIVLNRKKIFFAVLWENISHTCVGVEGGLAGLDWIKDVRILCTFYIEGNLYIALKFSALHRDFV